jgi:hypothetical protein
MSIDQILGIVRSILVAIGGFLVGKGYISSDTVNWVVGGVLTLGPAIWSWVSNRPAAIAASAQKIDGVNVQTSANAPADVKKAVADAKSNGA